MHSIKVDPNRKTRPPMPYLEELLLPMVEPRPASPSRKHTLYIHGRKAAEITFDEQGRRQHSVGYNTQTGVAISRVEYAEDGTVRCISRFEREDGQQLTTIFGRLGEVWTESRETDETDKDTSEFRCKSAEERDQNARVTGYISLMRAKLGASLKRNRHLATNRELV